MTETSSEIEQSPLDQIRKVEAEVIRKVVVAREHADQSVANARTRASQIRKQAQEAGVQKGQIRHQQIVSKAEEEARAIILRAKNRSVELNRSGQDRMDGSIQEAVRIILGLHESGGSHES